MRKSAYVLLTILGLAVVPSWAESTTDPGDLFVTAYMAVQQGEKAEQTGNLKQALTKLRSAATTLDQISSKWANWQPSIVDYRKQRTAQDIARVQEKIAHGGPAGLPENPIATEPPPLPQAGDEKPLIFETPDITVQPAAATSRGGKKGSKTQGSQTHGPSTGDVPNLFEQASARMKKLEEDLKGAKEELAHAQQEKSDLAHQLQDAARTHEESEQKQAVLQKRADIAEQALMKASTDGKADTDKVKALQADATAARRAIHEMRIEAEADEEYRHQLDDRYHVALSRLGQLTQERDAASQATDGVGGKIEAIQKQLDQVKKEKDELAAKLQNTEQQLSKVTSERDDAVAHLTKLQEAQKNVDKLLADNAALTSKLADAEKSIAQFKLDGAEKDRQIASLKEEVVSVKAELAAAKKESADYQRQMADLQTKLEESGKQLAEVRAENATNATEKKKMVEENGILRGIVLRQQKEEAVRAKTRKAVLQQLDDLDIHSKSLLKQIDFLGEPVVKLTDKERGLFKKPELQVTDSEISVSGAADSTPADKVATASPAAPTVATTPAATPNPTPAQTTTPAPVVQATATPAPSPGPSAKSIADANSTPSLTAIAKSRSGNKVADNAKKTEAPKAPEKTPVVEAPALPTIDTQSVLTLQQPVMPSPALGTPSSTIAKVSPSATMPQDKLAPAPEVIATAPTHLPDGTTPPAETGKPADVTPNSNPLADNDGPNASGEPNLPPDLLPLAREGKDQFERGNYLEAEKTYRKILAKAPTNLYSLSNLGVVLFRAQKFKLAEESFKKAIAVAPEDGFSHCTLGIVYYSQGKYDEAVNELTKALAINPKNATAHNYLGITASQKGWQSAAEKELETATTLDPQYADAQFNLAVVFATQSPPNKENARKYYQRATELGADRDPALEQLIK